MKRLSIVIPTFNRKDHLEKLLTQISEQRSDKLLLSVIVVVDGSSDGTIELLYNMFPEVYIVFGDGDWWYTKSINEGFRYAFSNLNPDYLLTLNDDVILSFDYLSQITRIICRNNQNTIVGSLGITDEKPPRIVTSGNRWKNRCFGTYWHHISFLSRIVPSDLVGLYDSVTLPGRGMLIPKSILETLNLFNDKFKQYHSDGDFTLRASKVGFKIKISWDAKLFVNLNCTSPTTSFLNRSYLNAFKSFFNPISRNYLPAKSRFLLKHGCKVCYPFNLVVFIGIVFLNVTKNILK